MRARLFPVPTFQPCPTPFPGACNVSIRRLLVPIVERIQVAGRWEEITFFASVAETPLPEPSQESPYVDGGNCRSEIRYPYAVADPVASVQVADPVASVQVAAHIPIVVKAGPLPTPRGSLPSRRRTIPAGLPARSSRVGRWSPVSFPWVEAYYRSPSPG
jgi:hypothetical protein